MLSTIKGCCRLLKDASDYVGCFRLSTEKILRRRADRATLVPNQVDDPQV